MADLVAIQMVSSCSVSENLKQVEQLLTQTSAGDLVLLPENVALFSHNSQATKAAGEPLGDGITQRTFSRLAKLHACYLIAGSVPIIQNEQLYATSLAYGPDGNLLAVYNKLHLFDVDVNDGVGHYRESDTYHAGNELTLFDTPLGKVGMAICYDLRFPALFSELRRQGADIILLPAAFTKVTGQAHWQPLLQARAIENQCYIIAANQGGLHENGRETWGHSMIIDPWGQIITQQAFGSAVLRAAINGKLLKNTRKEMPIIQHQRFSVVLNDCATDRK